MNKKAAGEDSSTIVGVLLMLVAVSVVVGIIVLFAYGPGSWLKSFLPDFNNTVTVKGVEKIRYNAITDEVQYFNGNNKWVNFPKGSSITLNDKIVDGETVKSIFRDYYYDESIRDSSHFQLNDQYNVDLNLVKDENYIDKGIKKGYIQVYLSDINEKSKNGYTILNTEKNMFIYPDSYLDQKNKNFILSIFNINSGFEQKVKTNSLDWLGSYSYKSLAFPYKVNSDSNQQSKVEIVCVEEVSYIYLVSNLADEVSVSEDCQ